MQKVRLISYITPEFLFLSWKNLISVDNFNNLSYVSKKNCFKPISQYWFKKTSYLINKGIFSYRVFNKDIYLSRYHSRKHILNKIKFLVIENALIFLLRFHFNSYFSSHSDFCDTEYSNFYNL